MQVTPWGDWNSGGGAASSGVHVNEDSSLQLLVVNGCVTLISDTIATLPRDIYRTDATGKRTEVTVKPRWFEQPNPHTDIIDFVSQSLMSLLLDGNAYWAYGVDLNFAPTEIHCLNPRLVEVKANQSGTGVEYWVNGQLFRGRLLHIKGATRPGALKGMSPIENARQAIGLGLGAQEFAGSFYANGTTMSGIIQSPTDLTSDQARTLKDNWSRDHSGLGKAHLPGVLTNGATWQQISITPEQAQFLQTREYQAGEICAQLFLLDPSMLGIAINRGQNLTYANLSDRGTHLAQYTLMRWIVRLERAFTFLLPKPQFQKFNLDALKRADLLTRYQAYRIALGPTQPFQTVNEVRELEDQEALNGYDELPEADAPAEVPVVAAPPAEPTQQVNHHHIVVEAAQVYVPEQRQPDVFVEVTAAEVNVPATVVNVPAAEVRVDVQSAVPDVHVAAPDPTPITVNVEQAENRIDVHPTPVEVNVAAADPTPIEVRVEAAQIEVNPTPIEIHPTEVNVAAPEVVFHAPEVNVNVAPPENRIEVNVEPTPVEVRAPDVFVTTPDVTVEAAQITVNQPEIRNDIHVDPTPIEYHAPDVYVDQPNINVESPTVHVRPPALRIDAPVINMPKQGKIRRTFERDDKGITIAIIEEPIEEADAASGSEQGPTDESH